MKRMSRAAALAAVIALVAQVHAGPNEGGILAVHGNAEGVDTNGDPCTEISLPDACSELVPTAVPDANGVEWVLVLAVREPDPLSLDGVIFGVQYEPTECYIAHYGPCHQDLVELELPSDGWPGPGQGTDVTWSGCLEGNVIPVYYLGLYVYAPGQMALGDYYPGHPAVLWNCPGQDPPDGITAFGLFGCGGAQGENPCGASSVPDDPEDWGSETTTWGRIKDMYR